MEARTEKTKARPPAARRFLRESLEGAVPLLVSWAAGRVRSLAQLLHEPTARRQTSLPPAAADAAPAPVKQDLDKHYEDFARDNPDSEPYSSPRSFPEEIKRGESSDWVQGNERGS